MKIKDESKPSNGSTKDSSVFADMSYLIYSFLAKMIKTFFRRLIKGPRRKAWSWKLEMVIALQSVSYHLLSKIGAIRYQKVLSKLLTKVQDGGARVELSKDKNVPGHWFIPPTDHGNVILYFHGGGYVYGSVHTHGNMIGEIACASSARIFVPDYCLAPEYPQPAAITDACLAYEHLLNTGVHPNRIVLAGDSAGGGLVISVLLTLRDSNKVLPAGAVCISPWVNLECTEKSFDTNASYDPVTREACLVAATAYLNGTDPRNPIVSPLFANLQGLPPLLIHGGEVEVLHDQIVEFALKAKSMRVNTTLKIYPDMVHVWHMLTGFTIQAKEAISEISEFIIKHAGTEKQT
ncbi:MAG: alpha/beta hydrolase [Saprospiraceae bacterium]|nr:alpha/beta hydrolase [Saprospiraceae bacterium]MBK9632232.1 alpha/beta hydrolase [Saprospiraceae bacterium]